MQHLIILAIGLVMAPITMLDQKITERGQDPEAGVTTLEYVILGALVLAVVVTVAAVITGNLESWAEQIPKP